MTDLPGGWRTEDSIWQLVECCDYVADLPAWSMLCGGRRVLDLGCGIGRVARHLAGADTEVRGLDRDPLMVDDFNRLAPTGITAVQGDVLDPTLAPGLFEVVIAPQQLIQIVGGETERQRLLELVARCLAPEGTAALAAIEDLPRRSAAPNLTPDMREVDQWVYSSRPVALDAQDGQVTVRRLRQRIAPEGNLTETRDEITFSRVDRRSLAPELEATGLKLADLIEVPPTEAHMASSILVLRKA